jgi:hypothetical protein
MQAMRPAAQRVRRPGDNTGDDDGAAQAHDDIACINPAYKNYTGPMADKVKAFMKAEVLSASPDAGADGLKAATLNFANSWYVAAALTMTVGFAMVLTVPPVDDEDGFAEWARWTYLTLTIAGTMNSFLGVYTAGHAVAQAGWHPAAYYSNAYTTHNMMLAMKAQDYAKISMQQLILAILPYCYLNHGRDGFIIAGVFEVYAMLQLKNFDVDFTCMRKLTHEATQKPNELPRYYAYSSMWSWFACGPNGRMPGPKWAGWPGFVTGFLPLHFLNAAQGICRSCVPPTSRTYDSSDSIENGFGFQA